MVLFLCALVALFTCQSLFARLYSASRSGGGAIQFAVFYSAVVGLFTLITNGFSYKPSLTTLIIGGLNAVIIMLYNISMLKAGDLGSYAFMMVCSLSGGILVPMVYEYFYLHTAFTALQIIGVIVMIASFIVMNISGVKAKKSGKYLVWVSVLFLVNGTYGVLMNLQQTLMNFTQRGEMVTTTFLGMAVITSIVMLIVKPRQFAGGFKMNGKSFVFMLLSSVCATVAANLLLYVMKSVNLTVLNVVNNGGVLIMSALAAYVIFKERATLNSIIGIALSCASLVMLSL